MIALVGVAFEVMRAASTIWVNGRTTTEVRATVLSFLSQAETIGETIGGVLLAVLASVTGLVPPLLVAAVAIAGAGVVVSRARLHRS